MSYGPFHKDLPAGTILVGMLNGIRIRVDEMRGDYAGVYRIRKDGERDRRQDGWSSSLPVAHWRIEGERTSR